MEQSREGIAPSFTHWYRSYWKRSLLVALDYSRQLYFIIPVQIGQNARNQLGKKDTAPRNAFLHAEMFQTMDDHQLLNLVTHLKRFKYYHVLLTIQLNSHLFTHTWMVKQFYF